MPRTGEGQVTWLQIVIDPSPMIKKGHLEEGVNGDGAPRKDGKTPLMLAVEAGQLDVVNYLLSHGADPWMTDAAGESAISIARQEGKDEIVAALHEYFMNNEGPHRYYNGIPPLLTATGGKNQSGSPKRAARHSIAVLVSDRYGNPLPDAPVRFSVVGGGKYLLTEESSPPSPTLLLHADESGNCSANLNLPETPNTRLQVIASAGVDGNVSTVKFNAMTNDGTGGDSVQFFEPSDILGSMNGDGGMTMQWVNHSQDETGFKVWVKTPKGVELYKTLEPHSTSIAVPPLWNNAR
jgi:hypothetical protein